MGRSLGAVPDYEDYVADEHFIEEYVAYQARYSDDPRESDKVLIANTAAARPADVLDIGCSTGNLLWHLRQELPDTRLVGGEISEEQLEACRKDPRLSGIEFAYMDATDLGVSEGFDVVIANATLCVLDGESYAKALQSIGQALRPGGTLLTFDWYHPWPQDLEIIERSRSHPQGMTLRFRSHDTVVPMLEAAGFAAWDFAPFRIQVDLTGEPTGTNKSGFEDLNTRTVKDEDGNRMLFRGTLYQPWCHLTAKKP